MLYVLFILVVSFLPGVLWLLFFYKQDKYEPEPWWPILLTFVFGMVATVPAILLELPLTAVLGLEETQGLVAAAALSFPVVGPIEELTKFLSVRLWVYRRPVFNEPVDGIVYAAAAALGFASLENLFYVLSYGWQVMLLRGPMSTVGHVLFSSWWGYALGWAKFRGRSSYGLVLVGLIAAAVAHGAFNTVLLSGSALALLAVPLLIISGIILKRRILLTTTLSPFRPRRQHVLHSCPSCHARIPLSYNYCPRCRAMQSPSLGEADLLCSNCGTRVVLKDNFCTTCGQSLA